MYDITAHSELRYNCRNATADCGEPVFIVYRPMTTFLRDYITQKYMSIAGERELMKKLANADGLSDEQLGLEVASSGDSAARITSTTSEIADMVVRYCIVRFEGVTGVPQPVKEQEKTNISGYTVNLLDRASLEPYLSGPLGDDVAEFSTFVRDRSSADADEKKE